ncbi:MAG: hypothetical protein ABJD07_08010 [Gemmatimonadaceae bacterium]
MTLIVYDRALCISAFTLIVPVAASCGDSRAANPAPTSRVAARAQEPLVPTRCAVAPPAIIDTVAAARADSSLAKQDSVRPKRVIKKKRSKRERWAMPAVHLALTQPATWPSPPAALPGSLFPGCRVVAYYGNPRSKRMGIMGEIRPDSMVARLRLATAAFAKADTTMPALPALELIAIVAQASGGKGELYRLRMPDTVIAQVAHLAESNRMLMIMDVQQGRSRVEDEVRSLLPWLAKPYMHLALDPEFAMAGSTKIPGKVIGTMDATEINAVIAMLGALVDSLRLPPKMLIIHRFRRPMLTNASKIALDPRVQVVIDMDGFGPPKIKLDSYASYVRAEPVAFTGYKLFYKNDKPLMTPAEVLRIRPRPVFVMYQ